MLQHCSSVTKSTHKFLHLSNLQLTFARHRIKSQKKNSTTCELAWLVMQKFRLKWNEKRLYWFCFIKFDRQKDILHHENTNKFALYKNTNQQNYDSSWFFISIRFTYAVYWVLILCNIVRANYFLLFFSLKVDYMFFLLILVICN